MRTRRWWVALATSVSTLPGFVALATTFLQSGPMAESPEGGLRLTLPSTEILPATILTVSVVLFLAVSLMLLLRRPVR